jgi:hypothetical protein
MAPKIDNKGITGEDFFFMATPEDVKKRKSLNLQGSDFFDKKETIIQKENQFFIKK